MGSLGSERTRSSFARRLSVLQFFACREESGTHHEARSRVPVDREITLTGGLVPGRRSRDCPPSVLDTVPRALNGADGSEGRDRFAHGPLGKWCALLGTAIGCKPAGNSCRR